MTKRLQETNGVLREKTEILRNAKADTVLEAARDVDRASMAVWSECQAIFIGSEIQDKGQIELSNLLHRVAIEDLDAKNISGFPKDDFIRKLSGRLKDIPDEGSGVTV